MTGLPESNIPAFNAAEVRLRALGYEVLNPARHEREDRDWKDYMRLGVRDLTYADGVALLPNWQTSKGATLETQVAYAMGLAVQLEENWKGS
jgi:hypothetical protein